VAHGVIRRSAALIDVPDETAEFRQRLGHRDHERRHWQESRTAAQARR
jgi:hypothetical protein